MDERLRRAMLSLSLWFDNQEHSKGIDGEPCGYGGVVQSGAAEGNKIPCTCGLLNLQKNLGSMYLWTLESSKES